MSTVCAATLLGGLVDLNVLDNQVAGVQTLGVGVGLGVLEERREKLSRLDGPASLADTELLAYGTEKSQYMYPPMHPRTWLASSLNDGLRTYLGQYGQCSRHISAWERPRSSPARSGGT